MNRIIYIVCIILILCLVRSNVHAENEMVNERLIRIEESIKSLNIQLNLFRQDIDRRFNEVNRRFNDQNVLNYFILGGIFTVLTLVSTLIVLIIWDRRSTLKPIIDEIADLQKLKTKVYEIYEHLGLDKHGLQQFKPA
ncbi:MAG: hypothetical protein OMM_11513 [Candidatus Magnetoglobus multicellularis str. Araruama]|uniref:Uncharacterized protein n=1 Tax=Candidatus Magnetoglobus multicellularis str. Araruama TaxID=890399 RepID=A0A1V1NY14_9BACT|nr:MAG: hypothetical protein OMM_11513 [Candidatus Magnetoglobus multicellularis str. Araruama]